MIKKEFTEIDDCSYYSSVYLNKNNKDKKIGVLMLFIINSLLILFIYNFFEYEKL